jgi:RNA polymerase sigma-70 factor, ECF subfamily
MASNVTNTIGSALVAGIAVDPRKSVATDDEALIARACSKDEEAFARLVLPHMRKAYRIALRITGNREDAEDATQQSLLQAYIHLNQFHGQSRFSTWFLRIAINEALGKVRKKRSLDSHLSYEQNAWRSSGEWAWAAGDESRPEVLYARSEKHRLLREAIDGLRGNSRTIVYLLGLEERRTSETAQILNMSEAAVKAQFARARQKLRGCLAERV